MTPDEFTAAQFNIAQQLGSNPSVSRVEQAIALLKAQDPPADSDWSALVQALEDAKATEHTVALAGDTIDSWWSDYDQVWEHGDRGLDVSDPAADLERRLTLLDPDGGESDARSALDSLESLVAWNATQNPQP